jgi:hypothetical protein
MQSFEMSQQVQVEPESSQNHSSTSKVALSRNKRKCPPNTRKRKIVIIGDSHARGIAAEISSCLGKDFEVNGTVMPGARLENITNLSDKEMSTLRNKDAVVIWGGANDISKNEVNNGLKHLKKMCKQHAKHEHRSRNTNTICRKLHV